VALQFRIRNDKTHQTSGSSGLNVATMTGFIDAETASRLARFLVLHDLTIGELWVLYELADASHMPAERLIRRSAETSAAAGSFLVVDARTLQEGVESVLSRGFAQECDEQMLEEIGAHLRTTPDAVGPLLDLPEPGDIDLGLGGVSLIAQLWQDVFQRDPANPRVACVGPREGNGLIVCGTLRELGAEAFLDTVGSDYHVESVSDIVEIGPWRARWWELFEKGWRIDVQLRAPRSLEVQE